MCKVCHFACALILGLNSRGFLSDEDARCIDEALKVVRHVFAFIQKDITTDMAAKLCRSLDKVFTLCEKLTSDVKESVSSQLAHLLEKLFKSIVAEAEHLLKKRSWVCELGLDYFVC